MSTLTISTLDVVNNRAKHYDSRLLSRSNSNPKNTFFKILVQAIYKYDGTPKILTREPYYRSEKDENAITIFSDYNNLHDLTELTYKN